MKSKKKSNKKRILLLTISILVLGIVATLVTLRPARAAVRAFISSSIAHISPTAIEAYPTIQTGTLSPAQQQIITLTKAEYAKHPVSYDSNVLIYTENNQESWCADYATWVLKQAGVPLSNPNSGHWRIPGVLTLQSYYQAQHKYQTVGTYTPKTGDVAIYIGKKTLDGRSKQHTNIVLKIDGDTMTTIGGNENGRMRISIQSYKTSQNSLVGFGTL